MTQTSSPGTARLDVLTEGYVGDRVAGTVVLIRDGDLVAVLDPGMVADRLRILGPLDELGIAPEAVTDVILTDHHPDHTINAALFQQARIHDFQATYLDDEWTSPGTSRMAPSNCRRRSGCCRSWPHAAGHQHARGHRRRHGPVLHAPLVVGRRTAR